MENTISFNKLVYNTCKRIIWQFFLAILLLYMFPLLFTGISISKGKIGEVFFNAFSWMYICLALILIVSANIRKMLQRIKKEMNLVYHKSMWLEPQPKNMELTLKEFVETGARIDKMQCQIKEMLKNEKKQREDLLFQISAASHDLRTPLTVIQGNSDLLLYTEVREEQKECLQDIATASRKINEYFNALIGYSKTFYDNKSEWGEYAVVDIVEAVEQEAFYLLKDKSILKVTNHIKEDGKVKLNLNYLLRAISNLISNALEYGEPKDKKIELDIKYENNVLQFSVWNKGAHLSKELLENCDKLFYRHKKDRNTAESHYGIGLAFVKRVAELHLGNLKISNLRDGVEVVLELRGRIKGM